MQATFGDFNVNLADYLFDGRLFSGRSDVIHDTLGFILELVKRNHFTVCKLRAFVCFIQDGSLAWIAKIFNSLIKDVSVLAPDRILDLAVGYRLPIVEETDDAVLVGVNHNFVRFRVG